MHPEILDIFGLIDAIECKLKEFQTRSGLEFTLKKSSGKLILEKKQELGIYRIFQEALTNVVCHSNASKIQVSISLEKGFINLVVKDNGIGIEGKINEDLNTLGILGMRERAHNMNGDLEIKTEKGKGTEVLLKVPLDCDR